MSPAPEIKTIFWDIGGVLLTNGWDEAQRAHTLTPLGVDLADFESRYEAANFFWERGLSTAVEFFNKTLFRADQPNRKFSFEDIWPLVCAESKVLHPECFDILTSLRGNFKVATLNNESRELNAYRIDAFNLRQYFDYFICSGYVHEMKPLPRHLPRRHRHLGPPISNLRLHRRQARKLPRRSRLRHERHRFSMGGTVRPRPRPTRISHPYNATQVRRRSTCNLDSSV